MDQTEADEFFDGRSIGYVKNFGWTWRGRGYDEGWEKPTVEDLRKVRDFIEAQLKSGAPIV